MPVALVPLFAFLGAAAPVAASIAFTVLVNLALGALSKLIAPHPPSSGQPALNVTVRGTIENRHLVFGRRRCAGVLVFYGTSGTNNKYLWYVVALAGHQVSAISDVWLDAVLVPNANINGSTGAVTGAKVYTFSGTLVNGSPTISNVVVPANLIQGGVITDAGGKVPAGTTITAVGTNTITLSHNATGTVAIAESFTYTIPGSTPWNGKLFIWKHLGTSGQAVDAALTADFGVWDSAHTLSGTAYVVVRMERDDTVFTTGAPQNISALVDGALVYDPRLDSTNGGSGSQRASNPSTWAWSANPALIARHYLSGGSVHNDQTTRLLKYGLKEIDSRIDDLHVIATANICDELLTGSNTTPAGDQIRYLCNLEATTGETRRDIMMAILGSMAGTLTYSKGKWQIACGVYDSPTHTLTQDDLYGQMEVQDTTPHATRYNRVAATYVDSSNQWVAQTTIFRLHSAYETQDGSEQIEHEIDLRGVTDRFQAQRIAEIDLRRTRMMRTVVLRGALNLLAIAQNETLTLSHARYIWTNRVFRCTERQFDYGQEAGQVVITAIQEDPAVYTDLLTADYLSGNSFTDTFTSDSPDTPTTLSAVSTPTLITFTVDLSGNYLQPGAVIELWEYTAITPFSSATKLLETRATQFSIAKSDTTVRFYWIRVRQLNGSVSGTTPATNGLAAAAGSPIAGPAGANAIGITLSLPFTTVLAYADGTVVSVADAAGNAIMFDGTTDVTASTTWSATATNCTGAINTALNTPNPGPKGHYEIATLTADAGNLLITGVYLGNTYTANFVIQRVKVGIEIVTSLPVTNLFQGRTVFLTSDNKLHRYTGSAWTLAVDGADIQANSILTNAITAGAVTAAKMATSTITAISGIIANAAIDSAQIANLAVQNAHIDNLTIGTGKVANNAITGSATAVGATGGLSISFTSTGGVLLVLASSNVTANSGSNATGRVLVNSSVVDSFSVPSSAFGTNMLRYAATLPLAGGAGSYTIDLDVLLGSLADSSLVVIELKK